MYLSKTAKIKLKNDSKKLCLTIAELLLLGWNETLAKITFDITNKNSQIRIKPNEQRLDYNFINNNLFYYGIDLAEIFKLFENQEKSSFNKDLLISKFIAIKKMIIRGIAHEKYLFYEEFSAELKSLI